MTVFQTNMSEPTPYCIQTQYLNIFVYHFAWPCKYKYWDNWRNIWMSLFYLYRGINNFLVLFIIKKVVISSFDTIHNNVTSGKVSRHVLGMKLTETNTYCVFNRSLLTKSHWYKDCLSEFINYSKSFLLST